MTSGNQNAVEELITCAICQEIFNDPRVLPCSHTYCHKCIEQIASANNDQFECPLRDGFILSKNEIDTLPVNRIARDMIEIYGSIRKSTQCSNCHTVMGEYGCDKCENETFCSECYQTVHTPRVMQKHQQIPINERQVEIIFCSVHLDEKVKYWCTTCRTFVCTDCILLEHKDHQYNLINKIAKELEIKMTNNFNDIQLTVENKINRANELINNCDNIAQINRTKVRDIMTSLRDTIDKHEQELLKEISTIEIEHKNQIEEYKTRLKYEPQNLSMQRAALNILLTTKNYAKLLNATQEFEDYIKRTNEILQTINIPNATIYELTGFDQLEVIKKQILQCGQYINNNNNSQLILNNDHKEKKLLHSTKENHNLLTVATSNDFPNYMYLPKEQRQKQLCRK
ncbi:unnamed protein product [Adineta steineri]|uniref:Uncharacterized protein n=1 Tax=Adineta steineri TaxID=433720 RepID=A0A814YX86_9BILA|nr:unnamed protein product [Adineta steineri]CAF1234729.1 unnamed protein product [Adineta steineri]